MKNILLFTLLLVSKLCIGQIDFGNNFDSPSFLIPEIGSDAQDSIWQIGEPQKAFFDKAYSAPNAFMTDTVSTYPVNLEARHTWKLGIGSNFPYVQLEWFQKTDFEMGVDGGIIDVSYDGGLTWLNVFDDPTYRPFVVGNYLVDTLANNKTGFTGTNDWEWVAICWGSFSGTQPEFTDSIQVRFTMSSDSIDTGQDGWMIDNVFWVSGVIGSTAEDPLLNNTLKLFPNPTSDFSYLDLGEINLDNGRIKVYNINGQLVKEELIQSNMMSQYRLDLRDLDPGSYVVILNSGHGVYQNKIIKTE